MGRIPKEVGHGILGVCAYRGQAARPGVRSSRSATAIAERLDSSYFTNYDCPNVRKSKAPGECVRIITKARLVRFWQLPGRRDAEGPLRAWYTHVGSKTVAWQNWGEVKATFRSASLVGNCVVFNIGGNKYRLVVRINYRSKKVFILRVMTHAEYDDGNWKHECGCFSPPPHMAPTHGTFHIQNGRGG